MNFGANHMVAAQWLTLVLAMSLAAALAIPKARTTITTFPVWPLALFFGALLLIAVGSLTPAALGGSNPIWTWAALPGSSTINRSATLLEVAKLLGLASIFMVGAMQGARTTWGSTTLNMVLGLGAAYATLTLLTFLSGQQVMTGGRLSGGFLSANSGATVYGVLTVLSLAHLMRKWRRATPTRFADRVIKVALSLSYVSLFAACLILTASRMGVVATAVSAIVFLTWETVSGKARPSLPTLAGGALILLIGIVLISRGNDLLWTRFDTVDYDSMVRSTIFDAHWSAFLDYPLFGHGLGTFNDVNSQIMTPDNYGSLWLIRAPHNVYIQWLEEAGIIGAAPMFALIAITIAVAAWRVSKLRSSQTLLRGLVAANVVILIHGMTDYALQTPSIAAFWAFLLGLQFAFGRADGSRSQFTSRD